MAIPDILTGHEADLADLVAIRRDIHAHPELSLREARTARLVAEHLRASGLDVHEGIGGHGVVATLRGIGKADPIALRADMDALAIEERTNRPYASRHAGVMHACGHDGHTTMLLGAARVLAKGPRPPQDVHFIFQPAEERHGGARRMMDDGLFERFPCRAIYGLHNMPNLPFGRFSTCIGPMMAAVAMFEIRLTGAGGHGGAAPHKAADLTLVQAEIITGLQSVLRRGVSPLTPLVLTVGYVKGGMSDAPNVMPTDLGLGGTIRCFDPEVRTIITERLPAFARQVGALHGAGVSVVIEWEAAPLVNDAAAVKVMQDAAFRVADAAGVDLDAPMTTGGEDFAEFLTDRPGAFMYLGIGPDVAPLHSPEFDFEDRAIPLGVAWWVTLARGG